jgi:hypothetical protein
MVPFLHAGSESSVGHLFIDIVITSCTAVNLVASLRACEKLVIVRMVMVASRARTASMRGHELAPAKAGDARDPEPCRVGAATQSERPLRDAQGC